MAPTSRRPHRQRPTTHRTRPRLTCTRAGDGALLGRFILDDAAATEFEKALRNAVTYDGDNDTRTHPQRNGDAIFDIAAFYNNNHTGDGTRRHLPHISISADLTTLTDTPIAINDDDARLVHPSCTDTYLCDCIIHAILRDTNGTPHSYGRSRYVVPRKLFRQIATRDGGCRFPGCDRNIRHCDAHHIQWWRHQGTTEYTNLVLLCSRHHHLVHHQHLHLKLLPNNELHVTWHNGQHQTSQPRGAPPKRKP
ncbi:MAG: DUF222 domain-containing protein [Actinobacteria bacterium]|nr:DUF222 domain-containing protein [Actinomycetota bacterium]